MDLILVMFVAGFALATLIFWPMLHRMRREGVGSGGGKHALRTSPPEPGKPAESGSGSLTHSRSATSTTSASATASPDSTASTVSLSSESGSTVVADQPSDGEALTLPTLNIELSPMPELPDDLYEKQFEAKFNRTRQRLARLRAQLNEMDEATGNDGK